MKIFSSELLTNCFHKKVRIFKIARKSKCMQSQCIWFGFIWYELEFSILFINFGHCPNYIWRTLQIIQYIHVSVVDTNVVTMVDKSSVCNWELNEMNQHIWNQTSVVNTIIKKQPCELTINPSYMNVHSVNICKLF